MASSWHWGPLKEKGGWAQCDIPKPIPTMDRDTGHTPDTTRRSLCLHPCLQLPHFRAHPLSLEAKCCPGFPTLVWLPCMFSRAQHLPVSPPGAERDPVTHQTDKGQPGPQQADCRVKHRMGTISKRCCSKPYTLHETGRGGPAGKATFSWWALALGPPRRKCSVLMVKPQGSWLDPSCGLVPQSWHPTQDPQHSPSRSLKVKFTMGSSAQG